MAFSVVQSGSTLYGIDQRGSKVALTLPTGVSLDETLRPQFAVFGNFVIIVNSPSRPITVDANLNVRVLTPAPPSSKPTGAASSGAGALTGSYRARQTFRVYDANGRLISESDFGPTSDAVSLTSKKLALSGLNLSADAVSASGLYRNTNAGSVYFKWAELDGNTQTTFEDDLSDASLSTLSAPSLGTPPNMYLISEFKGRLWGVGKNTKDYVNYSEVGAQYAWPSDNIQPIPRTGSDNRGATALIRRRNSLSVGRANGLYQISGNSDETFRFDNITENCGVEATDSVCVYKDVAFFLWKDGIYKLDGNTVDCITDRRIRRWFTTNRVFNLSRLKFAFAQIDPFKFKYRLFMASAGSTIENCWLDYDFANDKFWGPHMSHDFNPSCGFQFCTDSGLFLPMIGSQSGFVYRERKQKFDGTATPIDFDVVTVRHDAGAPELTKYFGDLTVMTKPNREGGTLNIQATVGTLDEKRRALNPTHPPDETAEMTADLSQDHHRPGRVGVGEAFKLRFRNNRMEDVHLRGYEVDPVSVVGKR